METHCFETAGLGKAPFRYVGLADQDVNAAGRVTIGQIGGIAVETKPGGTCAYCGRAILIMCDVESADGKRFHVGSECIRKAGDAGLIDKVESALRKRDKARREQKKRAALDADRQFCINHSPADFSGVPHPHPYRAKQGESAEEWVHFMLDNRHYRTLADFIRRHQPDLRSEQGDPRNRGTGEEPPDRQGGAAGRKRG